MRFLPRCWSRGALYHRCGMYGRGVVERITSCMLWNVRRKWCLLLRSQLSGFRRGAIVLFRCVVSCYLSEELVIPDCRRLRGPKGQCLNNQCDEVCTADDGNTQAIGPSTDCSSQFCRGGQCSNTPRANLGDVCDDDRDCSGYADIGSTRVLLYCGQTSSGGRRCGSAGAFCLASDGSGFGNAPELCTSGEQRVSEIGSKAERLETRPMFRICLHGCDSLTGSS